MYSRSVFGTTHRFIQDPSADARDDRKKTLPCHPELVVTRLCCQHFAERQNARLARRLLLFPKISLRCDFREPCLFSGHTLDKTRGAFTSIQTKSKQKGPALKGVFCAPWGLIAIPLWVLLLRLSPQSIAKCALSGCEAIASG